MADYSGFVIPRDLSSVPGGVFAIGSLVDFSPSPPPDPPSPPPVVTWITTPGSQVSALSALRVEVSDDMLVYGILTASFPSLGADEVVYRAGRGFTSRYAARSEASVQSVDGITTTTFALVRRDGWPAPVRIAVDVIDADAQIG